MEKELFAAAGIFVSDTYLASFQAGEERDAVSARILANVPHRGDKVRIDQNLVAATDLQFRGRPGTEEYLGVLQSLANLKDQQVEITAVYVDDEGDVSYNLNGSDLKVHRQFCQNALPVVHEFGLLIVHNETLWFVSMDDGNKPTGVFPLTMEPARVAENQLGASALTGLIEMLNGEENAAITGEFGVEDHGSGQWGLAYTPWTAGAGDSVVEAGRAAIEALAAHPAP